VVLRPSLILNLFARKGLLSMKILMIASEVTPFAKTGGLADVIGSLPKELKRLGHDVRVIIPFYKEVEMGDYSIRKGRKSVEIASDGGMEKGLLRQASFGDIPVYLLEHKRYFYRDHLYGTPSGDYPDNAQRFAFFCRGVIEVLKKLDFRPDVLHCHDWQAALIPILLRYRCDRDPFFMKTITIFTIHNLAYQGLFPVTLASQMGIDPEWLTMERLEFYGKINLMKGGIVAADAVTTVSPTYSREILTAEHGCGLEGVLETRSTALHGILNGLDYSMWDPAEDRHLVKNYSASAVTGKLANKVTLQGELGLEQSQATPLIGMVTRLASQKGLDLLLEIAPRLVEENLQLVILGSGDELYVKKLSDLHAAFPRNISVTFGFKAKLAHRIYAGSDIFLMPSHYEPCGLGQMIALRYGSVPVVRKTGGLADTVMDKREGTREPNGFTFDDYSSAELLGAVMRAVEEYRGSKTEWRKLVRRGMNTDLSWQRSAELYEALYQTELERKRVA